MPYGKGTYGKQVGRPKKKKAVGAPKKKKESKGIPSKRRQASRKSA